MAKHIFVCLFFLLNITSAYSQQRIVSSVSEVRFEVSNMRFNTVEGTFSGMAGTIQFDTKDLANARLDVCVSAKSVDTDNEARDKHLRKEDFFHVEKYPTICFQSDVIAATASGYVAKGTLKMHGVSKAVSIPFTFTDNTFTGTLTLDRTDYQVGSDGSFMVGKEVKLTIVCSIKKS